MIKTKQTARTPEKKLDIILNRMSDISRRCNSIPDLMPANLLLDFYSYLTQAQLFLSPFAGDVELIDYANSRAIKNIEYPDNYDVQLDFAGVGITIANIKSEIELINMANCVSLVGGMTTWVNVNTQKVRLEALKMNDFIEPS